jgi:hypothetical protein
MSDTTLPKAPMPDPAQERRAQKRVQVLWINDQRSSVHDKVWLVSHENSAPRNVVYGLVADISENGVKILVTHQNSFVEDEEFELVIYPPESSGLPQLQVTAKKCWDAQSGNNFYRAVGVCFETENPDFVTLTQHMDALPQDARSGRHIQCEIHFQPK